jgi:hypothetical protein
VDAERKAEARMDHFEALADAWAGEVNLAGMITNATAPMNLRADASTDVRQKFHDRMKSQIFAIAQQAFIEGAARGVDLVNDELRKSAT